MSAGRRPWSKLQSNIESRFAPSLEGRLRVRCVGYRNAHDADGRAYFEFDGEEIGNFCNLMHPSSNPLCHDPAGPKYWWSTNLDEFNQHDFLASCLSYRNLSIDDALASKNPLHLALAVVDRRCGQRRLDILKDHELPPIAARLLEIRLATIEK